MDDATQFVQNLESSLTLKFIAEGDGDLPLGLVLGDVLDEGLSTGTVCAQALGIDF